MMKNNHSFKDYILPSGKIIKIQGYENIALDELVKIYNEDDIFTSRLDMPKIQYYLDGEIYSYYPDIYIKSIDKIIEVKSTWTYKRNLIKNIHKTRKLGLEFEFWIYDDRKNKLII